ncbi:ATP-binding protein [Halohasta salina]|uniref:ATP-binding protein n=1 Tax=Halohasta salina TaxID=2961621 RepID=UPI0020A26012|nr:ATP-binding protein [Halohasta salina]
MSANPPLSTTGKYRVVRREPGYLVMYSVTGEPATVGTRGYDTELQQRVDAIQQGDGIKLSGRGIHQARTVGRIDAVKIVDRRAIRLVSRPAPVPEPFAELWDGGDGGTVTGGFANGDGDRIADVVLEPESTELLAMFWNGLVDFESQFEHRQFGDRHPSDVLVVNNESTDYITVVYHTEITKTLQEIYQRYFAEYDPATDTGDRFKAELLYPEYRQFRGDLPEDVPSQAVLESERNPYPHTERLTGPVLDQTQPAAVDPRRGRRPTGTQTDAASADSDGEEATAEVDDGESEGEHDDEPAVDDQPAVAAELDEELTQAWTDESAVTMADYGGRPELTETIRTNVIVPFRDRPEQAAALGVPVPSILLYGPPGTGKTYLAKAVAGEIGYPYVTLSGGDVLSRYINASAENINELFAEARALADEAGGALIFIDEIDSVLKARQSTNQHAEDQKVVNEFLTQIEDIGEDNVLFVGATNAYDELDAAALSRFDKELFVGLPDEPTREAIIETHLSDRAHTVDDEEIAALAADTEGYSARALTKIVVDAARRTLVEADAAEITADACRAALEAVDPDSEPE